MTDKKKAYILALEHLANATANYIEYGERMLGLEGVQTHNLLRRDVKLALDLVRTYQDEQWTGSSGGRSQGE